MNQQNEMKFYHLELNLEINQEIAIDELSLPGIFGVECVKTNRIFIMGAENTFCEISLFFENLTNCKIKNPGLLKDFETYGRKSFKMYVFQTGFYFEHESKREWEVSRYQDKYAERIY